MKNSIKNKHIGSTLDDFLQDEDIYEEVREQAIKEMIASAFTEEMKKAGITKTEMATGCGRQSSIRA